MSTHPVSAQLTKEERILDIAYKLWEEEGRPNGRDLEHWNKACELVEAEVQNPEWLIRSEATAAAAEAASPAPAAEVPTAEQPTPSIDDLVKRMKSNRAA